MDMLNHSNTKKLIRFKLEPADLLKQKQNIANKWNLEDKTISFNIYSSKKLDAKSEIFDEYDKQSNARLLLMHGFCLEDNPYNFLDINLEAKNLDHKKRFGRWSL